MKKTNSKLQLKANTLRVLQDRDLSSVAGGRVTFLCTMQATACFGTQNNQGGGDNNGA